jgi:hypothetical protein
VKEVKELFKEKYKIELIVDIINANFKCLKGICRIDFRMMILSYKIKSM